MYDSALPFTSQVPPDNLPKLRRRLAFWEATVDDSQILSTLQRFLTKLLQKGSRRLGQQYHLSQPEIHAYQQWLAPKIIPAIHSCEENFTHKSDLVLWVRNWCESRLHGWMLEQIAAKDPEAISALYRYLYAEVLPGFRKQVRRNGGKRELADDLFQEAFLTVIKKIQEMGFEASSPQKLSAYVAGISKNLFIGSRRRKAHRMRVDGDPLDHQVNRTYSVEEDWINQEKAQGIQLQIRRLGKICQEILIRFFYEEKSHQEIASELGKTPKSIRNQQYRCMKKLRAACEDMFDLLT